MKRTGFGQPIPRGAYDLDEPANGPTDLTTRDGFEIFPTLLRLRDGNVYEGRAWIDDGAHRWYCQFPEPTGRQAVGRFDLILSVEKDGVRATLLVIPNIRVRRGPRKAADPQKAEEKRGHYGTLDIVPPPSINGTHPSHTSFTVSGTCPDHAKVSAILEYVNSGVTYVGSVTYSNPPNYDHWSATFQCPGESGNQPVNVTITDNSRPPNVESADYTLTD